MVSTKITAVLALALGSSLSLAEETCLMPSKRTTPGRDIGGFGNYVCPGTIDACKALCPGGAVETNTCTNDSEYQEDNPFDWITYCYECTCADGSSPDLSPYRNTVPNYVCQRRHEDCFYSYNQFGGTAPDGACPACGGDYAPGLEPHYPWETTTTAAAEPTTSTTAAAASTDSLTWTTVAEEIPVTTETPSSSTDDLTFITSTVPVTTDASSEATALQTWTSTLNSTTSAPLSSVLASKTATQSTSSAAAVPTSGAKIVEPVMGLGMVMAAVFAL